MTREFFARVLNLGHVKTRKHEYKCIASNGLVKIVRNDNVICAVYAGKKAL